MAEIAGWHASCQRQARSEVFTKSKLIFLMVIAGASAFAQTRFSIQIGGYGPRYYAPPRVYYRPALPYGYRSYGPGRGGPGYWGEDPDRQHRRAEWYGLRNHQERERYIYGDSPELQEHQAQAVATPPRAVARAEWRLRSCGWSRAWAGARWMAPLGLTCHRTIGRS
jgi:hypothetical protein